MKRLTTFLLLSVLLITSTACQLTAGAAPGSAPTLTLREGTNCRAGPGEEYEIIFTYAAGTALQAVGRDASGNFWVVKSDKSPTGTCWLWGEFADVTGNSGAVPVVAAPSTSTAGAPVVPSGRLFVENWEYSCNAGKLTFTLAWKDQATDEMGYRIFRNGQQIVELPADSATYAYTDSVEVAAGERVQYYLQVFGAQGSLNSAVMEMSC